MPIIGHSDILSFFEKATQAGRLHHAYLFVGPRGLGKRAVAEYIARQCFGETEKPLHTNPDFLFLARGVHEKTGKTKKHISVDDVERVRQFFYGKPFLHEKKITIIDDAHLLSTGAMNALLKTLEEPRGDAIVFLIAEDSRALLPTIRSRCQTFFFHPVSEHELEMYLLGERIDPILAKEMARNAGGIPGRAIAWAEDPAQYEWYQQEKTRFLSLVGAPFHEQLARVDELFEKKDDHIAGRVALLSILDIWLGVLREHSTQGPCKYDIVETYHAIHRAKEGLSRNVHPRLLIEHILFTLG